MYEDVGAAVVVGAADMEMGPFPLSWSASAAPPSSCGGTDMGVIMGPGGGIKAGAGG